MSSICPTVAHARSAEADFGRASSPISVMPEAMAPEETSTTSAPASMSARTCAAKSAKRAASMRPSSQVSRPEPILITQRLCFMRAHHALSRPQVNPGPENGPSSEKFPLPTRPGACARTDDGASRFGFPSGDRADNLPDSGRGVTPCHTQLFPAHLPLSHELYHPQCC